MIPRWIRSCKQELLVYSRCICFPGGAAGAVSRITGTLGKGIAALTMDEKYKQERRQAMGKKPVNVKEGLTRGGKGLFEVRINIDYQSAPLNL